MKYEIVPIGHLIPLELVFPTHLKNLETMIDNDGFMLKAIIADGNTGVVLDGSHRYAYLLKKGFKEAPVHWVNYDDENIRVGTQLSHRFFIDDDVGITKAICKGYALAGQLLSPRTTRHFFPFRKIDITLPLDRLKKGEPVDVSHLISDACITEEMEHNEHYIKEINEEVEIIINYLSEVSQTKSYLTEQVDLMRKAKSVGFFPGKFHPPHIGHIKTMLTLLSKYKKLIIGVSEHQPEKAILTPDEIQQTLTSFFEDYENVEVCRIEGVLVEKETLDSLPEFDVLLSGNEDVLEWATKHGLQAEYVQRSVGYLYSGTEIRTAFIDRTKEE
jgi:nicotinamide mononucleotide adenylyltransferase